MKWRIGNQIPKHGSREWDIGSPGSTAAAASPSPPCATERRPPSRRPASPSAAAGTRSVQRREERLLSVLIIQGITIARLRTLAIS